MTEPRSSKEGVPVTVDELRRVASGAIGYGDTRYHLHLLALAADEIERLTGIVDDMQRFHRQQVADFNRRLHENNEHIVELQKKLVRERRAAHEPSDAATATMMQIVATMEKALRQIDDYSAGSTIQPVLIARDALRKLYGPNFRTAESRAAQPPDAVCVAAQALVDEYYGNGEWVKNQTVEALRAVLLNTPAARESPPPGKTASHGLARSQLENMRTLPANWDSYGAVVIDHRCIDRAHAVLNELQTVGWAAVPCTDGGVQLERHQDGLDIEIWIDVADLTRGAGNDG